MLDSLKRNECVGEVARGLMYQSGNVILSERNFTFLPNSVTRPDLWKVWSSTSQISERVMSRSMTTHKALTGCEIELELMLFIQSNFPRLWLTLSEFGHSDKSRTLHCCNNWTTNKVEIAYTIM